MSENPLEEILRSPLEAEPGRRRTPWGIAAAAVTAVALTAIGVVLFCDGGSAAGPAPAPLTEVPGDESARTVESAPDTSVVGSDAPIDTAPSLDGPTGAIFAEAVSLDTDRVMVFGGFTPLGSSRVPVDGAWMFNPQTATWTESHGDGPSPRMGHRMVLYPPSGKVVLFGGGSLDLRRCRFVRICAGSETNETWLFDPESGIWEDVSPRPDDDSAPAPRFGHGMAYDPGTERIVLVGGVAVFGSTPLHYEDAWSFDPVASTWVELSTEAAPPGRAHGVLVHSSRHERMLLFGGDGIGPADDDRLWALDPATAAWEDLGAGGPDARWLAAVAIDVESGALLVAGGEGDASVQLSENVSTRGIDFLADVWLHDPALGWVEQVPLEEPIGFVAAAGSVDGVIVIGSGHISRYLAAADRWEELARAE